MSKITNPGYVRAGTYRFTAKEFEAIEQAWSAPPTFRNRIQTATDNYVLGRTAQRSSAGLGESKHILIKLEKPLAKSAEILSTLHDRCLAGDGVAITAFDALSARELKSPHSLDNDLYRLEILKDQCLGLAEAVEKAKNDLHGSSGPNTDEAFAAYLRGLGKVYKRATGRRPWANWHDASKSYRGRFQNGVAAAVGFLGENRSNIALAKSIKAALSGDDEGTL